MASLSKKTFHFWKEVYARLLPLRFVFLRIRLSILEREYDSQTTIYLSQERITPSLTSAQDSFITKKKTSAKFINGCIVSQKDEKEF